MAYQALRNTGHRPNKGSLIMLAILLAAGIALLGYFGINIKRDIADNPNVESNFSYVSTEIGTFWNTYLEDAAIKLWHWTVVNITNLPVGSGNGIKIPQITYPGLINTLQSTDRMNGQPQVAP